MAVTRTFSIIKPDATRRNLTGAITKMLEEAGLRVVASRRIRMTRQQAEGLADRLYGMGAVKIYAFGGVMSLSFAIELPDDKDKRAAIFDWYHRKYEENLSVAERVRDVGQKYLLVHPGL